MRKCWLYGKILITFAPTIGGDNSFLTPVFTSSFALSNCFWLRVKRVREFALHKSMTRVRDGEFFCTSGVKLTRKRGRGQREGGARVCYCQSDGLISVFPVGGARFLRSVVVVRAFVFVCRDIEVEDLS